MSTDQVSRKLAKVRQALADRFGDDAMDTANLFKLAHQLANMPQGAVLFDRLVVSIRTTKEEDFNQ